MKSIYRHIQPSVTMGLDAQAKALAAAGRDVINLTAGQVDLPMPEAGKAAIDMALKANMTGYVPDLLGNISMLSGDREIFGTGGCGKGYKEWVKVTDGGPYLKTKARLG